MSKRSVNLLRKIKGDFEVAGANLIPKSLVLKTEALTGAGACSTTIPVTLVDTTGGAAAITLAAGSNAGQVKHIIMVKDGGNATLTLANAAGAADEYTFANVGESVALLWGVDEDGAAIGWVELSRGSGAVAGATAVVGLPAASAS